MNTTTMRRFARACALLTALVCHWPTAVAQDLPTEQSLRAAMVFNFLKFAEFAPEQIANASRIRLCIAVADQRQAEALVALAGRKVWNRELGVVRLAARDDDCQVLYVDSRPRWNLAEEQGLARRTLTIGSYTGFAQDGGMIEIVMRDDATRFDINLGDARRAGVRFAPQLLRLARQVHE